jgi:uncharacterized protein (TIGR02145 family)
MTKNLDVTVFRNGDTIPEAKSNEEWKIAGENQQPAWCYFENDPNNGKIYNWYAVYDSRGLGQEGWIIPTVDDWTYLVEFLGGENIAGKKLKSKDGWNRCEVIDVDEDGFASPSGNFLSGNGTDEISFSCTPNGERWSSGEFQNKEFSFFWTSNEYVEAHNVISDYIGLNAMFVQLSCLSDQVYRNSWRKSSGYGVRMMMNLPRDQDEKSESLKEINISGQIWATKNLNTNHFQNGDLIIEAKNTEEWLQYIKAGTPAWCYYDFNQVKGKRLGKLYNWPAIIDPRNIAPLGWHIPENEEWNELLNSLGGTVIAGSKLKNNFGWDDEDGNNESGFSGLPSGEIDRYGNFNFIGQMGVWWSKSEKDSEFAYHLSMGNDYQSDGGIEISLMAKDYGLSVRCIKDK